MCIRDRSSSSQSKTQGFRRSRRSLLLCSFAFERSKVEGSSGAVSCWRLRPSTASNSKREVLLLSVDLRLSKESKELAPLLLCLERAKVEGSSGELHTRILPPTCSSPSMKKLPPADREGAIEIAYIADTPAQTPSNSLVILLASSWRHAD